MAEKIYIGDGKEKVFDDGGSIVGGSINLSKIPKEHITTGSDGNKYLRYKLCKRRSPSDKGQTHYIEVDTWKPDPSRQTSPTPDNSDDAPF